MSHNINNSLLGSREPEEKLRTLSNMGNAVKVDPNIPLTRQVFCKQTSRKLKMTHSFHFALIGITDLERKWFDRLRCILMTVHTRTPIFSTSDS